MNTCFENVSLKIPSILGQGVDYRFEISDFSKLKVDLQQITKVGLYFIRCWISKSGGADFHHM